MTHLATEEQLVELEMGATQGIWGQFSTSAGPGQAEAAKLWKENRKSAIAAHDSSHHMSALRAQPPASPKRLATFTHADDAAFAESLVNLWRAGFLTYTGDLG
jgi:hypothetical protein